MGTQERQRAQKQVPRDAFVPLEYSPGEAIQVDWGEARFFLGGKKLTINMWCMRECYSGDVTAETARAGLIALPP